MLTSLAGHHAFSFCTMLGLVLIRVFLHGILTGSPVIIRTLPGLGAMIIVIAFILLVFVSITAIFMVVIVLRVL
jgi:hypothetical protein